MKEANYHEQDSSKVLNDGVQKAEQEHRAGPSEEAKLTEHEELDGQNGLKELPEQASTQQTTSDAVLDGATK